MLNYEKTIKLISIDFLDRVLYDTKMEWMKYIYKLIKNREVDTDVILTVFDNKHDSMFSEISCFLACEGMYKRILNDIKKEYGVK